MYIYDTCDSIRAKRTSPAPKHANGVSKRVHLSIEIEEQGEGEVNRLPVVRLSG